MSLLLDTLRRLGAIRPCDYPQCSEKDGRPGRVDYVGDSTSICSACHGTGVVLDLRKLLAKPEDLCLLVGTFFPQINLAEWSLDVEGFANLQVVGSERVGNLAYEVAHQLGGTAVVAERLCMVDGPGDLLLSQEIPTGATVLFVTDRMREGEMLELMDVTMKTAPKERPHRFLPYVFALISSTDVFRFPNPDRTEWKVVSLHQERP